MRALIVRISLNLKHILENVHIQVHEKIESSGRAVGRERGGNGKRDAAAAV